jgi:trans-2,3-dihydro-3-hydroxyanthranilate isomerase
VSAPGGQRRIAWLDVFTADPFAGNQLAVVDGDGLGDEQMHAIARELTISETAFVKGEAAELTIWTPAKELPGAGHPVIGAAIYLAQRGDIPASGTWVFLVAGSEVMVELRDGTATMTQPNPGLGVEVDTVAVAGALQIDEDNLVSQPQFCTTGVRQIFAEVRDYDALAALHPDMDLVAGLRNSDGLVAWCEVADGEVAQRFFAPQMGIPEDPATGSAAGALGSLRVFRGATPGSLLVRQGAQIHRPSEIHVQIGGAVGAPSDVRVGGRAVVVFEGTTALVP